MKLLLASAMLLTVASASNAPRTASGKWSDVIKGPMASNQLNCVTMNRVSPDTFMIVQVDQRSAKRGKLIIKLFDQNWSIRAGDDLPNMAFLDAEGGSIRGTPIALEHAMMMEIDLPGYLGWAEALNGEPYALVRDGLVLARFSSTGLAAAVAKVRDCGRSIIPR